MLPFKTTSLNVSAAATIGTTLSAKGIVYAQSGNSSQWNSAHTTVQTNSATWGTGGGGGIDLNTVTNYLSTNNVVLSSVSVTDVSETLRIVGGNDITKKLAFEVDGLSTATTVTLTIPNRSGTIALMNQTIAVGFVLN